MEDIYMLKSLFSNSHPCCRLNNRQNMTNKAVPNLFLCTLSTLIHRLVTYLKIFTFENL